MSLNLSQLMEIEPANKSVCCTGHRDVLLDHSGLINSFISEVCESADEIVLGGAIGFDTIVLGLVCDRADVGLKIPSNIIVIVADTLDRQPVEAIRMIVRAKVACDARLIFVELESGYNAAALKYRNHVMIDRSLRAGQESFLLTYWRGIYKSGTWSAISYAKKNYLAVRNIVTGISI